MLLLREHFGALLIAAASLLGIGVSASNYLTPLSGIDGTPGALLVIVSTAILSLFAVCVATLRLTRGLRRFIVASSLLDIAGTAFAAYLLESSSLLILMAICFAGWLILVFSRKHISAEPIARPS
jgi:hypothetical protein